MMKIFCPQYKGNFIKKDKVHQNDLCINELINVLIKSKKNTKKRKGASG